MFGAAGASVFALLLWLRLCFWLGHWRHLQYVAGIMLGREDVIAPLLGWLRSDVESV